MKKLSVITINFNDKDGLRRTIESVVNQTWRDFEYIVIDGGSTDGSVDVIKEYESQIDYWVSEPDRGIYHAMNKGVAVATGEYCNFMNSGDYFHANETLISCIAFLSNDDIIVGNTSIYVECDGVSRIIGTKHSPTMVTFETIKIRNPLCHQSSFIKTSLLQNNPYDETLKIVSDWKFLVQELIFKNRLYKHIDFIVSNYNNQGVSATYKNFKEKEIVRSELFKTIPYRILQDYYGDNHDCTRLEKILLKSDKNKFFYKAVTAFAVFIESIIIVRDKIKNISIHQK